MNKTITDQILKARINLYYDLQPAANSSAPLLIALHGYGAFKEQMMREAQQIAPDDFAIASLQGFHQHMKEPRQPGGPPRYGFGWLTSYRSEESVAVHQQALLDLIDRLVAEGVADPSRVFLLGFSQSCALNYRFAFTYPERLLGVVGICGGIPGDWETSTVYRQASLDVFHLAGTEDEFYPPSRVADYEKQLGTRARSVASKSYHAGHEIVPEMRTDVKQWLARMQIYNLLRLELALAFVIALVASSACETRYEVQTVNPPGPAVPQNPKIRTLPDNVSPFLKQMLEGAIAQAGVTTEYDPAYVALDYPNGDVPEKTGVCSDVVVRAFRKAGIDLQKEVHEDMKSARSAYPTKWGANAPDKNIDHRRVLNLMKYFERRGKSLPISNSAADYQPGDVVAWELSNGIDHIGIVTNMVSDSDDRLLIVHNIGAGTRIEDVVFSWTIKGHYRFF